MPLPETMGAPVFGGTGVTEFINAYDTLLCLTGTNLVSENVIATIHFCLSESIQKTINQMKGLLKTVWDLSREEMEDALHHANSRV